MKILLLGATGKLGQEVLIQLQNANYSVCAFVRTLSKMTIAFANLEIAKGDILNEKDINNAMKSVDVVIWAIGHENSHNNKDSLTSKVCSIGTLNTIKAMTNNGVKKIIAVSSWGVGVENRKKVPFFFDKVIFPLILEKEFADKERQEDILRQSNIDFIIVKPSRLTNSLKDKKLKVSKSLKYSHFSHTSRKLLANLLVDLITNNSYSRQTLEVSC